MFLNAVIPPDPHLGTSWKTINMLWVADTGTHKPKGTVAFYPSLALMTFTQFGQLTAKTCFQVLPSSPAISQVKAIASPGPQRHFYNYSPRESV